MLRQNNSVIVADRSFSLAVATPIVDQSAKGSLLQSFT